ncbi:MAG: TetR family transcriptional regulator C-terminal domain-containing protein [Lishizhenia sp.]
MKKEKLIAAYIDFVLSNGREPHSVYELTKSIKKEEADFYTVANSIQQLRKEILVEYANKTLSDLDADKDYETFSSREKLLALFFTLFENFKQNRSYLIEKYQKIEVKDLGNAKSDWNLFFNQFQARAEAILAEGKNTEEIKDRPYIGEHYAKGFKIVFTYVFRVWLKDESSEFSTTDAAIEKSVNLAFDMLGQSPLDSLIDFGKFALKTKVM